MSKEVFLDTAGFIALGNADDEFHQQADILNRELISSRVKLITTDDILNEVANAFSKPINRHIAIDLIDSFQASASEERTEVVQVGEKLWDRGFELYKNRPDKDWGLIDCISFVLMGERRITQAFSSDHHFEQAGFVKLLLK